MRHFALAAVVLAAAVIALPTSARTFRVDANRCDVPNSSQFECWDGVPSGANPAFPALGDTNEPTITDGLIAEKFNTSSFEMIAFNYALFMANNAAFFADPNNDISAPFSLISHGLRRSDSVVGSNFLPTDTPLYRVYWIFDYDLYSYLPFHDIFADKSDFFDPNLTYFGVELIFDGQGFDIFGLNHAGFAYAYSDVWGPNEPCERFDNEGFCVVPEPSSVALLGLGFLALVVGLRTGRRTKTYLV